MEGGLGVSIVLIIAIVLILRSLEREGKTLEMQGMDMKNQGYTYPPMQEEAGAPNPIESSFVEQNLGERPSETQDLAGQSLSDMNSKDSEAGVRENMGVHPGETPWRPDNASRHRNPDMPQPEKETAFDADYFKD